MIESQTESSPLSETSKATELPRLEDVTKTYVTDGQRTGNRLSWASRIFPCSPADRRTRAQLPVLPTLFAWQVVMPSLGLDLQITTPLPSQELVTPGNARLSYWEGAIAINGSRNGARARGVGYLEMTGYASPLDFGH